MKTLKPLIKFVIDEYAKYSLEPTRLTNAANHIGKVNDYAEFLNQELKLGQFIPCDEEGNILHEPKITDSQYVFELHDELLGNPVEYNYELFDEDFKQYQEAKSKVLFEGFHVSNLYSEHSGSFKVQKGNDCQICIYKAKPNYWIWNHTKVIDLVKFNLTLTQTAQSQLIP